MRFLVRNRNALLVMAVFVLAGLMVLRQYRVNEAAHREMREDFIVLESKGYRKPAEHLFQVLAQELSRMPDKVLVEDLLRTGSLVDAKAREADTLLWKYHTAVQHALKVRAERRVEYAIKRAEAK